MQTSVAKKIFAVGLAASTIAAYAVPFVARAAAHAAGTNVKSSDGTIWMIMTDGTRRAYTSGGAFLSYGFNSFSSVVDANAEDLALPAGSFIPPQDGKVFCATATKGSDVAGECSLITGGQKAAFTSAAVFTGLGFSFSRAMYGDSSFLSKTSNIANTTDAHRTGVLVNNGGTVQLVGANGLLGIPDLATFNSWGYSFADVVPANAADKTMTQTGVMVARQPGQLSPSWTVGQPPVTGGSISASLASDNPVAQTIAVSGTNDTSHAGHTVATLAKFAFSGNGAVTQLQLKRSGVSPDSILSNVYLFDGNTRLTDAASVGGNGIVTFNNPNGLFTVSGSKTVSVVAEISNTSSAGQTVSVQLISYTVGNSSPVSASISGNLMTTAVAADLAWADFGTVTPASNSSYDPASDLEVFRSNVTVNQRDMTLSRFILRNTGSAQAADIVNFRLRIDGTQVAQVQSMDSNGYVSFSFSPVTLKAGSRGFSVLADIVGGSSRNFAFQIRNKADVNFVDTQYNVATGPSTSTSFPVAAAAVGNVTTVSINAGSMTIQKATDSPSGNVTDGTSDVTLAKYTVTAYGEPMKIETIKVGVTSSDVNVGSLRNGRVLLNGVQYGSTATLSKTTNNTYTTGGTQYTLNYVVQPGTSVTLEVHADMFDNDGTNNLGSTDTVTVYLMADGTSNVQRMTSLGYVTSHSSSVAGNAITDVTGSMTVAKNATYANQVAPLPQVGYKLGSFSITGSTSEAITINTIDVGVRASTSLSSLYNVKVMVNGNMFGTQKGTASITNGGVATSSFSGSVSLPANSTMSVEVYGDINAPTAIYSSDTFAVDLGVSGTAMNSSASVSGSAAGQTISVGVASLAASQDPSTPAAALVAGNQTKTAAAFKFQASHDQYTISEVVLTPTAYTSISSVELKDGSQSLGTKPGAATVTFSNLNIVVPANTTKILTVDLILGNVGIGAGQSGENVKITLTSYKSAPSSTGTIGTTSPSSVTGNNMYVLKGLPTITNESLPTSALVGGVNTLAKFTVGSSGGSISWTHLAFTYSTSSAATTLTLPTLWDVTGGANNQVTASASVDSVNKRIIVDAATEQGVSGAKTYALKATVGGTLATSDYITTYIANPNGSTFVAPATAATATSTIANSFVWSDQSGTYATGVAHGMTTTDWYTDALVKNLPTDSQTLTK